MVPSLRIQALHQSSAPSDASEIILFHSKSLAPSRAYSLALATPQRKYDAIYVGPVVLSVNIRFVKDIKTTRS